MNLIQKCLKYSTVLGLALLFVLVISHKHISAAESGRALLQPSDFTYLGYYAVYLDSMGLDNPFGQGLTSRYVNGDFRLMYLDIKNEVKEFSLAGKNFGDKITKETNTWPVTATFRNPDTHNGLWWDQAGQRLWTTSAIDYNTSMEKVQIVTQSLNNDDTVSNVHGPVGIQGISAKRVFGGAQPVPEWFQKQYGVGPYIVGWGGYTSIVCTGPASLGPTMYSIPDPSKYPNNSEIPNGSFKNLIDASGATCGGDWYASGKPTTEDRGERLTNPQNYFDGGIIPGVCGDDRKNGNTGTPPPNPPCTTAEGGKWQSPAPDGLGRWTWGDTYNNTGLWIDTPTKTGFIAIASLGGGKVWYCNSSLCYEKRQFELHIYDPVKIGEAASGSRAVWNVKPASMTELKLPGLGMGGSGSGTNVSGATFDPVNNKLYLIGYGVDIYGNGKQGYTNRVYVYQVNTGSASSVPITPQAQKTFMPAVTTSANQNNPQSTAPVNTITPATPEITLKTIPVPPFQNVAPLNIPSNKLIVIITLAIIILFIAGFSYFKLKS